MVRFVHFEIGIKIIENNPSHSNDCGGLAQRLVTQNLCCCANLSSMNLSELK